MIKPLSVDDVDKIVDLQSRYFPDGWTKQGLLEGILKYNLKGLVFYQGQTLIAFATYSVGLDFAELMDILVEPACRKKGVATSLLNSLLQEIKGKVPKIFLEVREGNLPAVKFYSKHGFTTVSVRKKYYPDGENALVMEKELI